MSFSVRAASIFFYSCLAFVLGVFLGSFWERDWKVLLVFSFFGALTSLFLAIDKKDQAFACLFWALFFLLGWYRVQEAMKDFERPDLVQWLDQELVFFSPVVQEPKHSQSQVKLMVYNQELKARILVKTSLYPEIKYGDVLRIKGALKEPPALQGFNYQDYLKSQGVYFLMDYPEIKVLSGPSSTSLRSGLFSFKNRLKQGLEKILPLDQAGFFEALIFGEEENISKDWKEKLNATGTRHLAAVSGMNISIISVWLVDFLIFLGLWRQQAFWLSLLLILGFILMIGAPASAVRAGIMGGLFLLSQHSGRIANSQRLLVLALAFMLSLNPLLLRFDIGFELSFLAVAGLIYLQPFFARLFQKLSNFNQLRMNLSTTLAAQTLTLPLLLYNFGQVSLVAPITNVLILPAIPYLTLLGFGASFFTIFSQVLGRIIFLPSQLVLFMIMKAIDFFSQLPWSALSFQVSGLFVLVGYSLLAVLVYFLKRRQGPAFLNY